MQTKIVSWMASLLMLVIASVSSAADQMDPPVVVTDLAGRTLTFEETPQRIILGESRYLAALSIFFPDNPIKPLAGMLSDLKSIDLGTYQLYQQRFPNIDQVAKVGHTSGDSFSVEKALTLQADLAIFGVSGHGPNPRQERLIEQLEKAGVQVVFVDFRNAPLVNTPKSIELLGQVLRKESQAEDFNRFYQAQLQRVTDRLAKAKIEPKPNVFIHSRVGVMDLCCETMVRGMMAAYVEAAEGGNIATEVVPGYAGVLNLEYLLTHQPDVYIATAVGSKAVLNLPEGEVQPYIALGAGVNAEQSRASFKQAVELSGLSGLDAVRDGRAYAIWHHFYNTPINVVAVQVIAKWLYPDQFADLDPRATLQTLFDRYQAIPLEGTYWLELSPER